MHIGPQYMNLKKIPIKRYLYAHCGNSDTDFKNIYLGFSLGKALPLDVHLSKM